MKEHKARKRFGQNFLQDTRIISDIVNAVRPQPDDIVIEIGPGLAAITEPLAKKLNRLHVCEIDRDIVRRLKTLPFADKLVIHEGDVLQFDSTALKARKNCRQPAVQYFHAAFVPIERSGGRCDRYALYAAKRSGRTHGGSAENQRLWPSGRHAAIFLRYGNVD